MIATPGAMATLAVVLSFALAAPVAQGASPGVSPDPAPQAAPPANGGAPGPDAAPQAPAAPAAVSGTASQSVAPVASGSAAAVVASPSLNGTQSNVAATTTKAPVLTAPSPVRRSARSGARRLHRRPSWIAEVARQLTAPWRQNPLDIGSAASSRSGVPAREGMLLLLGAIALTVLAFASGSMLRLLRRMEEVPTR